MANSADHTAQRAQRTGSDRSGGPTLAVLGGLVLLLHALNALVNVASRLQQILVGLLHLILGELHP